MILLVIPTYILNTEGSTFQKEHFVNCLAELGKVYVAINHEKENPINLEDIKRWKASSKINKVYLINPSYKKLRKEEKESIAHRFRKHIENFRFPDSNFPYWKSIVYDEYLGSLQSTEYKIKEVLDDAKPSFLLIPIPSVINSMLNDDLFTGKFIYFAKQKNIPVIGFQYAPLIDKNFVHLYYGIDYFIVNSEAEKQFLINLGLNDKKIFIAQEKYISLWSRNSFPQLISYWSIGKRWRENIGLNDKDFVIGSSHIFSHRRELIEIIDILIKLKDIKIIINTSRNINRRGLIDSEIARNYTLYKYKNLIGKNIFIVEDQIMNVLYFSDALVLCADITYNILDLFRKPVVVFQKGLQTEIVFKNITYTGSKDKVKEIVNNYKNTHLSLEKIFGLLTEMQTNNSSNNKQYRNEF